MPSGTRRRRTSAAEWETRDRLPPRHDQHCLMCFRTQIPAADQPAVVTRPAAWDLDRFLADMQAG